MAVVSPPQVVTTKNISRHCQYQWVDGCLEFSCVGEVKFLLMNAKIICTASQSSLHRETVPFFFFFALPSGWNKDVQKWDGAILDRVD
jgi:ABC-type sulfate transport system substrate-binding protein